MAKIFTLRDDELDTNYIINLEHVRVASQHAGTISLVFDSHITFTTTKKTPEEAQGVLDQILDIMTIR